MRFGRTPEEKEYSLNLFSSVIRPAANRCGYEKVWRADLDTDHPIVTQGVVRDLASADLVIADLTGSSPNVFYELGIRHVLHHRGTVAIVQESTEGDIPFDNKDIRAVVYSTDFKRLGTHIQAITDAIKSRETDTNLPDNPVHAWLPLPRRYTTNADQQMLLASLQTELGEARKENEGLRARIAELAPPQGDLIENLQSLDVEQEIDRIARGSTRSASELLIQMQQLIESQNFSEVFRRYKQALMDKSLTEQTVLVLAEVAQRARLTDLVQLTLEVGVKRFRDSISMKRHLAESYCHAEDLETRRRGRQLLERLIGLQYVNGQAKFGVSEIEDPRSTLGILADALDRDGEHLMSKSMLEAAVAKWGADETLSRSLGRALSKLNENAAAEQWYQKALEIDPSNDQTMNWYGNFLRRLGKLEAAIRVWEQAAEADPTDPRHHQNIAILILARGDPREQPAGDSSVPPKAVRLKQALKYFARAILIDERVRHEIATVLAAEKQLELAQRVASGEWPPHGEEVDR